MVSTTITPMICPRCGHVYPVSNDATRAMCTAHGHLVLLLPTDEAFEPVTYNKSGLKRHGPSASEKARILGMQGDTCAYCDAPFGDQIKVTWDHFVPFSYSEKNDVFVAACQRCNSKKGSKIFQSVEEVRVYISQNS